MSSKRGGLALAVIGVGLTLAFFAAPELGMELPKWLLYLIFVLGLGLTGVGLGVLLWGLVPRRLLTPQPLSERAAAMVEEGRRLTSSATYEENGRWESQARKWLRRSARLVRRKLPDYQSRFDQPHLRKIWESAGQLPLVHEVVDKARNLYSISHEVRVDEARNDDSIPLGDALDTCIALSQTLYNEFNTGEDIPDSGERYWKWKDGTFALLKARSPGYAEDLFKNNGLHVGGLYGNHPQAFELGFLEVEGNALRDIRKAVG